MQRIETTIALLRDLANTEPREGYKIALENAANLLEGNPTPEMLAEVKEIVVHLMPGLVQTVTDFVNGIKELLNDSDFQMGFVEMLARRTLCDDVIEESLDNEEHSDE